MAGIISGLLATYKSSTTSYDADASTYFTAAGITDATQKNAVNAFVLDCKANGNWDPCYGLYVLVGGTSSTHAVNLKSPGTYNLNFTGITHSAAGIQGDGTTNVVDTGIQPSTVGWTVGYNTHLSFYTSTTTFRNVAESSIGLIGSVGLDFGTWGNSPNTTPRASLFTTAQVAGAANGSVNGFWIVQNANSTNLRFTKNGVSGSNVAVTYGSPSTLTGTIKLTCRSNNAGTTISRRSSKMYSFFSIGKGLGNVAAFSAAVATLQTSLGR